MLSTSKKRVIINGVPILYGTEIKTSRETNASTIPTFDGVLSQGTSITPFSIEISRASYLNMADTMVVEDIIDSMVDTPGIITIIEEMHIPNETPFAREWTFTGCILDGDDYEMKPEEHSVNNLKFKCAKRDKVNVPL